MNKTKISRLTSAMLETADDMHGAGIMDAATHEKITIRHLGSKLGSLSQPVTSDEIRLMREQAHVSQAVFARHLNMTVGYISQLERGVKRPTGAALALLNVIRRKGCEVVV